MVQSKIKERLDLSNEFLQNFNVWNNQLKKQVSLYVVMNINSRNIITLVVNPKEYFGKYKDKAVNRKI